MGEASAPSQVTTPDTEAPSAPGTPAGQALSNPFRIDLTWGAATDNVAVTGYEITRDGAVIGTSTGAAYSDVTIGSARAYSYAVVAVDAAGNRSAASAPVTVTSLDSAPPTAPSAFGAVPANGPDRVQLSWAASADDIGVTGYEILRDGALLASVTSTTYVDVTAQQGVVYVYDVRAHDGAGNRSAAARTSAMVADLVAPSAPPSVSAKAYSGPSRVLVTWTAAGDNVAVAGYRVYRNGVLLASTASLTYLDYAVTRKTTYRYAIRAIDAAGNLGASSATVSATAR
jgi:fibronectin type 3 domain-containing protein